MSQIWDEDRTKSSDSTTTADTAFTPMSKDFRCTRSIQYPVHGAAKLGRPWARKIAPAAALLPVRSFVQMLKDRYSALSPKRDSDVPTRSLRNMGCADMPRFLAVFTDPLPVLPPAGLRPVPPCTEGCTCGRPAPGRSLPRLSRPPR